MTTLDVWVWLICFVIIILTILSSTYDFWTQKFSLKSEKLFTAFSLTSNTGSLLKINKSPSVINCIDGLKVLSTVWIVMGHRKMFKEFPKMTKFESFYSMMVDSFTMSVTTFFVCSGILVTQSLLKAYERGRVNIVKVYAKRYVRFASTMGLIAIFYLSSYFGNGQTDKKSKTSDYCVNNIWRVALFIQNYGPLPMCFTHTWYLSADFTLFLFSPLLAYNLKKYGRKFCVVLLMLIVALEVFYYFDHRYILVGKSHKKRIYQTDNRAAEYLIGVLTGWIMYTMKKENDRKWKIIETLGWIVSCSIFYIEITRRFPYNSEMLRFNFLVPTFLWALGVAWIIFACHQLKSGGLIRSFLSHVFWQPLSKLCLTVYIIHYIYITHKSKDKNFHEFTYTSFSNRMHIAYGDVFASFLLAAVFHILIEIPVANLTNLVIGNESKITEKKNDPKKEYLPM